MLKEWGAGLLNKLNNNQMETNKKQTAVNWIIHQIDNKRIGDGDNRSLIDIFNEAKQMEREQIESAFTSGYDYCRERELEEQDDDFEVNYYEENYGKTN